MTLIEACCHIPHGFMLRIESETSEDDGHTFLHATIYQHPPGWAPGDVFDDADAGHGWPDARHEEDRFRDAVVFSIGADTPRNFERLLINAIVKRWPKPRDGLDAWRAGREAGTGNKHGLR